MIAVGEDDGCEENTFVARVVERHGTRCVIVGSVTKDADGRSTLDAARADGAASNLPEWPGSR